MYYSLHVDGTSHLLDKHVGEIFTGSLEVSVELKSLGESKAVVPEGHVEEEHGLLGLVFDGHDSVPIGFPVSHAVLMDRGPFFNSLEDSVSTVDLLSSSEKGFETFVEVLMVDLGLSVAGLDVFETFSGVEGGVEAFGEEVVINEEHLHLLKEVTVVVVMVVVIANVVLIVMFVMMLVLLGVLMVVVLMRVDMVVLEGGRVGEEVHNGFSSNNLDLTFLVHHWFVRDSSECGFDNVS